MGHSENEASSATLVIPSLISGGIAGSIAKTVIAPLDRTKINFQVSRTKRYSFKAAFRFVKLTYVNDGFLALFRGNSATMARVIPYASIQFCAHEQWKNLLQVDKNGVRTPGLRYIAGSLAAVSATIITFPLDTAKARLSTSTRVDYPTLTSVFTKTWKQGGIMPLYRGMWPTLLGVIPYAGTSFFTYETLKIMYEEEAGQKVTPLWRLAFGAVAGLIGQSSSYPLDIVRRRMQTGRIPREWGVLETLSNILSNEGLRRGLYKGLSMNWVKGPIAVGVSFTTYDHVFDLLKSFYNVA